MSDSQMDETWNRSFQAQREALAYNMAPPEAVVRNVAYYLRSRYAMGERAGLRCLDLGCGAGAMLRWLGAQGVTPVGIDASSEALALCRELSVPGFELHHGSVTDVPLPDASFAVICEANVLQHLDKDARAAAFREITRLLKRGGLFAGYMMSSHSQAYGMNWARLVADDERTVDFGTSGEGYHLASVGLCHFFTPAELREYLKDFATVDLCYVSYDIPTEEARRRGQDWRCMPFWAVYAIR